jgi:outer membrane protein TolC
VVPTQHLHFSFALVLGGALCAAAGCVSPGRQDTASPPVAAVAAPVPFSAANAGNLHPQVKRLPPVEAERATNTMAPVAASPAATQVAATSPRPADGNQLSPIQLVSAQEALPRPSFAIVAPESSPEMLPPADPLVPPGAEVRQVTMANILASVAGRNPEVGFATQRYAEAYARLIAARALWLPAINAGVGWNNHAGPLQASDGIVNNINRSSLTAGLGVQTIGAGSPVVPGLFANFHSAEAIFQPRIANRDAAARDAGVRITINDLLLETSLAYLDLLRAHQLRAIAIDIRQHAEELAEATAQFARTGAGTEADADRAATELSIRQNEVVRAEEEIQVASARVVQLLNDDPRFVLQPLEPAIAPVELVPLDAQLQTLLPTGLTNRPELAEAQHLVGAAVHRYRMEKWSPWLPNVLMGTSYAGFGGGPGSQIDNTAGRFDLDAIAYWQVRSMGVGEYAARREARARYDQTRLEQVRVMNLVSREIVEAQAQVQARHRQIVISQQAVKRATASFERNWLRVRDLKGLPIETLQSIQALDQARREYLRALVDYNAAQFRLQRALGWPVPPTEMAPTRQPS